MKTKEIFKIGKEFSYIGSNFENWFGNMLFDMVSSEESLSLTSKKLPRCMNDSAILAELKPTEVSLEEMYDILKNLDHSIWAIFYIKDVDNVVRAVYVRWDDGGWSVEAYGVSDPDGWSVGYQVFSRNWDSYALNSDPLNPSHSDTLEIRVKKLESDMAKLRSVLSILN